MTIGASRNNSWIPTFDGLGRNSRKLGKRFYTYGYGQIYMALQCNSRDIDRQKHLLHFNWCSRLAEPLPKPIGTIHHAAWFSAFLSMLNVQQFNAKG